MLVLLIAAAITLIVWAVIATSDSKSKRSFSGLVEKPRASVRNTLGEQVDAAPAHVSAPIQPSDLRLSTRTAFNDGPTNLEIEQYTRWYLLSRFENGADLYGFAEHPVYAHRLGMPPERLLQQFIADGWIRKFNAAEALNYYLKMTDLKEILKMHDQPITGKKNDLVQRVLDLDDDRVRRASEAPFFILTEDGSSAIKPFYRREIQRHETARNDIEQALREGNIEQALSTSAEYNRRLLWSAARIENDEIGRQTLTGIISSPLGEPSDRILAAMMALMPERPPGVPARHSHAFGLSNE